MYLHAKQSGELLSGEGSKHWQPDMVRLSAEKIGRVWRQRERLNVEGLMVVSGAGNFVRGEELRAHGLARGYEDALGRWATFGNIVILGAALGEAKVPTKIFLADTMGYSDPAFGGEIELYDIEAVKEAYGKERVVLIAGGTGEDNKTTDNAVVTYGGRHASRWPEDRVIVLKGTKHDGVFDGDPRKNVHAPRYSVISARFMLDHYDGRFEVVDRASLQTIINTGLDMRVYADSAHDLETVLASNGEGVGTLIVAKDQNPVFA